jgi:hypothetical protein
MALFQPPLPLLCEKASHLDTALGNLLRDLHAKGLLDERSFSGAVSKMSHRSVYPGTPKHSAAKLARMDLTIPLGWFRRTRPNRGLLTIEKRIG